MKNKNPKKSFMEMEKSLCKSGVSFSEEYNKLREIVNEEIIEQKDFHFLPKINVKTQDCEKNALKLPVILILDNLRSAFNVGSIIRTAECLNIEEIYFCGYTPKPDHPKIKNTAMGTEERIKWQYFTDTREAVLKAKENEYIVYAIETVECAESLFEQDFKGKYAFVFGNEALGIAADVLVFCEKCVMLPISGWKNSLNVATTCAVVCFEVVRQNFVISNY